MADTTVDLATTTLPNARYALRGPYRISPLQGVIAFLDSGGDPSVRYTLDGGANRTKLTLDAGAGVSLACFFDREIPGNYGTALHIVYADNAGAGTGVFTYLKWDFNAVGSVTVSDIVSSLTWNGTSSNNKVFIGLTNNYNIIAGYLAGGTSSATYKRTGGVGSRSSITNIFEGTATTFSDIVNAFPANTGDNADMAAIFWDISANAVSIKMYDDSADTRTETAIISATSVHATAKNMDGAIRHSDRHLLVTFFNDGVAATSDLLTYDITVNSIASPTITGKTNVFSNTNNAVQPAIIINQQNNDVYIGVLKNGTWLTSESVVFYKSTDGMVTRGGEQAYSETARDYRIIHGGRSIGLDGGMIQFGSIEFTAFDLWINLVNDIQIAGIGKMLMMGVGK